MLKAENKSGSRMKLPPKMTHSYEQLYDEPTRIYPKIKFFIAFVTMHAICTKYPHYSIKRIILIAVLTIVHLQGIPL